MKGVKIVHIPGTFWWDIGSVVLKFWIFKCFLTIRNCHFRLLLGGFLTSDDMQYDASGYGFYWSIKKEMIKIGLKNFLVHFVRFFIYVLLHLMSYPPRYISLVSFISIAFVVVKLKYFKVFYIDSASMKCNFWVFLGPYSPKYCSVLLKVWPGVVSNKCLKNPLKLWILA